MAPYCIVRERHIGRKFGPSSSISGRRGLCLPWLILANPEFSGTARPLLGSPSNLQIQWAMRIATNPGQTERESSPVAQETSRKSSDQAHKSDGS